MVRHLPSVANRPCWGSNLIIVGREQQPCFLWMPRLVEKCHVHLAPLLTLLLLSWNQMSTTFAASHPSRQAAQPIHHQPINLQSWIQHCDATQRRRTEPETILTLTRQDDFFNSWKSAIAPQHHSINNNYLCGDVCRTTENPLQ